MPVTDSRALSAHPWDRVTVVLVTYNSGAVIGRCMEGLHAAPHVIVVDNASSDDTLIQVRAARPDVRVIANRTNIGLGAAVNQGFDLAATDYGLLLNPDAVTPGATLARMVATLDGDLNVGLVVPLLEDNQGRVRLSVMGPFEHNHHPPAIMPEGDFSTWFVTGSVMLARLAAWREVGGFDEAIFLYHDDAELCLRMTNAGHALRVLTDVRARHAGGGSVRMTWRVRWLRDWHMTWGHLYIESRHGSRTEARRQARALIRRHGVKALFYLLVIRPQRLLGNLARSHAALAFLRDHPSWPGRPPPGA